MHALRHHTIIPSGMLLGVLAACADLVHAPLPSGVQNPSTYNTPAGALLQANGAVSLFQTAIPQAVIVSGMMTDELTDPSQHTSYASLDARIPVTEQSLYGEVQQLRGQAQLALGVLGKYAPDVSPAIRGEMYALQGYGELWLADAYCSGVPLSTIDFEQNFTYQPGSSTTDIYRHAAALFDSALALSADSVNVQLLARVGLGRALLAVGQFDSAAQTVASVSDGAIYQTRVLFQSMNESSLISVIDREGENGLSYLSGDPRVLADPFVWADVQGNTFTAFIPAKYNFLTADSSTVTVADWIEARLIQAEASLHAGDTAAWLRQLNHLRTTAITPALDTLTDPGVASARLDTMFAERAAWLYLTGHRLGDMRRLIRQYGRRQDRVFPVGSYGGAFGSYGDAVNIPVPDLERRNPLFRGCLNRNA